MQSKNHEFASADKYHPPLVFQNCRKLVRSKLQAKVTEVSHTHTKLFSIKIGHISILKQAVSLSLKGCDPKNFSGGKDDDEASKWGHDQKPDQEIYCNMLRDCLLLVFVFCLLTYFISNSLLAIHIYHIHTQLI